MIVSIFVTWLEHLVWDSIMILKKSNVSLLLIQMKSLVIGPQLIGNVILKFQLPLQNISSIMENVKEKTVRPLLLKVQPPP